MSFSGIQEISENFNDIQEISENFNDIQEINSPDSPHPGAAGRQPAAALPIRHAATTNCTNQPRSRRQLLQEQEARCG